MPLIIQLKKPDRAIFCEGEPDSEFINRNVHITNQSLFRQDVKGRKTLIPLNDNTNIAYIQEISQDELERMEEKAKKMEEENKRLMEMAKKQGQRSGIVMPQMMIPGKMGRGQ